MKKKYSFVTVFIIFILALSFTFQVHPLFAVDQAQACFGAIEGAITPASCGAGFQVTVKDANGKKLWSGMTSTAGTFTTPFVIPEGTASVEAMKIGCDISPNPQRVSIRCKEKARVEFTCKCEGHEEKKGRLMVYIPLNCLRGTTIRVTGVSNNQMMVLRNPSPNGYFDSGCELFCDTEYMVEPINEKCTFTPSSRRVKVPCCPQEVKVTFQCKCEEPSGRIQVILPYECKEGTSVHIYSDRGQLIKTLTGAFDTGCTLPCPARYKVVPVHPQKTFTPPSQEVDVPCCPQYAKALFEKCQGGSTNKGKLSISIPRECQRGTVVYVYNSSGRVVTQISPDSQGSFQTECILPCPDVYNIVPKNEKCEFTPASKRVKIQCCPSDNQVAFQCKCEQPKGRIIVSMSDSCASGTTLYIYNSRGQVIKTLTSMTSQGFDTGCTLDSNQAYNVVPKNDQFDFSPASRTVEVKACPEITKLSFRCTKKPDKNGRIVVKLPNDCITVQGVSTVINIYSNSGSLIGVLKPDASGSYDTGCRIPCNQTYSLVPQNEHCSFSPSRQSVTVKCCPDITTATFKCSCEKEKGRLVVRMDSNCILGTIVKVYDTYGNLFTTLTSTTSQGVFDSGCTIPCNKKYEIVPYNSKINFSPPRQVVLIGCCPDATSVSFTCGAVEKNGSLAVKIPSECQSETSIYVYDAHGNVASIITSVDSDGYYRTGCKLPGNQSYKVVPKNQKCTFDPPVRIVTVDYCPKETKTSFNCDCEESEGRIQVHMSMQCAKDAKVTILDENGNTVVTLTNHTNGTFDTGCTLPCNKSYKVVPEKKNCTFSPSFKIINNLVCCPGTNSVAFECDCQSDGARFLIKIPNDCIHVDDNQTSVYIYDPSGKIVDIINAPGDDGYYDTGKILQCDTFYKVVPRNPSCSFQPESQLIQADCTTEATKITFTGSCEVKKGRIYIQMKDEYKDVVVHVYDQETNHLILTLTDPGQNGFDTGCVLSTDTMYQIIPTREGCSFNPPSVSIHPKECPDASTVVFEVKCEPDCFGGIQGYFVSEYTKGASIEISQNGKVVQTIQSDSLTGYFDTSLKLPKGTYKVTPSKKDCVFTPASTTVDIVCNQYERILWHGKYNGSTPPVLVWLDSPIQMIYQNEAFPATYQVVVMIAEKDYPVSNCMAAKIVFSFDSKYLSLDSIVEGDFLKQKSGSTFFTHKKISEGKIEIDTSLTDGSVSGYGKIAILTFTMQSLPAVDLSKYQTVNHPLTSIHLEQIDIRNEKGSTISTCSQDAVFIASEKTKNPICDFNKDGLVNFDDMMIFSFAFHKQFTDNGWNDTDTGEAGTPYSQCDIWCDRSPVEAPLFYSLPDGIVDFNDLVVFSMNYRYYASDPSQTSNENILPLTIGLRAVNSSITVSLSLPSEQSLKAGDTAILSLDLSGVSEIIRGFNIELNYPNSLIKIDQIEEGSYFTQAGVNGTMFVPTINKSDIKIAAAAMSDAEKVIEKGTIAKIHITCLAGGTVSFEKTEISIRDAKNNPITGEFTSPSFSIGSNMDKTIITLQIGSKKATINGKEMTLDAPPFIVSGRTVVPLRFVSEGLGAKVEWDGVTKHIHVELGSSVIDMTLKDPHAMVNGKQFVMDVPPFISNGRTMVPIRFVSEALGATVSWDGETQTITIEHSR